MFLTTTKFLSCYKNLLKTEHNNNLLIKTQNFREIFQTAVKQQQQKAKHSSLIKTFVTTEAGNGFKRQQQIQLTEKAAGVVAAAPSTSSSASLTSWPYLRFLNKQTTPCQNLNLIKNRNRTLLAYLESQERFSFLINKLNYHSFTMVTAEEAVKYLEIPDKSENDKKHYKWVLYENIYRI